MANKTIKQQAIEHYKRMIEWAKTQPLRGLPNSNFMKKEIKEAWFHIDCIYCKRYINYNVPCPKCPL